MPDTPNMPDVTPIQKLVGALTILITAVLANVTSFGLGLTVEQDTKLLALWTAFSAFVVTADAIIRQGRAKAHAAITIAAAQQAALPPAAPTKAIAQKSVAKTPTTRKPAAARTAGSST